VFSCGAAHAVSTPSTAIPAIPRVNNLLETRFMIITLPSAVNSDNGAGHGPSAS
jgi:hypothetical protein